MLEGRLGRISNAEACSGVLRRAGAWVDKEFRGVWGENLMLEGRLGQEPNAEACWGVLRRAEAWLNQEFRDVWGENLVLERARAC